MTSYRAGEGRVTLIERCRALRQVATSAEVLLWQLLRGRQIDGAKFRRQHQFGRYILDFYCHGARLAIELDGGHHLKPDVQAADTERTAYLASCGIRVLRFTNQDVLMRTEEVVLGIWQAVVPHPSPLQEGEGDAAKISRSGGAL